MKHQVLLTIQEKFKLAFFISYFSVRVTDSGEILASGRREALKYLDAAIYKYVQLVFAVLLKSC